MHSLPGTNLIGLPFYDRLEPAASVLTAVARVFQDSEAGCGPGQQVVSRKGGYDGCTGV